MHSIIKGIENNTAAVLAEISSVRYGFTIATPSDADMVFFIYRADYYPEDDDAGEDNHPGAYHKHEEKENHETSSNSNSNISATTLILAKNRNGPIGDVNLQFFKDNCRFEASTNTSFVGEEDQ